MPTACAPCPGKTKAREGRSLSRRARKGLGDVGAILPGPGPAGAAPPARGRSRTRGRRGAPAAASGTGGRSPRAGPAGDGARGACAAARAGISVSAGGASARSLDMFAPAAFPTIGSGSRVRAHSSPAPPGRPSADRRTRARRRIRPRSARPRTADTTPGSHRCRAAASGQPPRNIAAPLPVMSITWFRVMAKASGSASSASSRAPLITSWRCS